MFKRSITASSDEETEINLSPMIDCIFILLIFFIVTTVFVEESGIQINKPDSAATPPPPDEESETIVLEILENNKVYFEGNDIGIKGVKGKVKQRLKNNETPVSIKAHEKSDHGIFISVWDEVKLTGATQITFSTEN